MKISLGRTVILVKDYDEALKFYDKIFDCRVLYDKENEHCLRLLHIGFHKKEKNGIWFMKAEGEEQEKLVGKQTGGKPTLVFYTDDFDKMRDRIKLHEAEITKEPVDAPGFRFMHFLDLYGNEIVLVELDEEE